MAGTTALGELPISGLSNSNIPLVQSENIKISNPLQEQISSRETDINKPSGQNESAESYNELIAGLQNASQQGQTELPDRNIPQQTTNLTTDETIQPNYIPESKENKYVENEITNEDVINYNKNLESQSNNFDNIYQELQLPILIAILYFLFQLPIIQKYLYKIIPGLFKSDGNPNIFGYILNSLLFSVIFYALLKGLDYFSSI
mgnify:CR=1 FL=1